MLLVEECHVATHNVRKIFAIHDLRSSQSYAMSFKYSQPTRMQETEHLRLQHSLIEICKALNSNDTINRKLSMVYVSHCVGVVQS